MNTHIVDNFLYYTQYKRKINFFYYIFEKKFIYTLVALLLAPYLLGVEYSYTFPFFVVGIYSFYSYSKSIAIPKYYEINKHWVVSYIKELKND